MEFGCEILTERGPGAALPANRQLPHDRLPVLDDKTHPQVAAVVAGPRDAQHIRFDGYREPVLRRVLAQVAGQGSSRRRRAGEDDDDKGDQPFHGNAPLAGPNRGSVRRDRAGPPPIRKGGSGPVADTTSSRSASTNLRAPYRRNPGRPPAWRPPGVVELPERWARNGGPRKSGTTVPTGSGRLRSLRRTGSRRCTWSGSPTRPSARSSRAERSC